ncbi:MAG: hypothetical protein AAF614_12790 [Chloroflexota bacterium]
MNRLEWILGIILLLLVLFVGVFAFRLWQQGDGSAAVIALPTAVPEAIVAQDVAPTPAFAGETAKVAFAEARGLAVQWAADAELVTATATWPQGSTEAMLQTGSSTWGFTFFSSGAEETAVITVVDGEAQLVNSSAYVQEVSPQVVLVDQWELDSQQVIDQFLTAGGSEFMGETGPTTFSMTLGSQNSEGILDWSLTLFEPENGRSLYIRYDAQTGDILQEVAAP